MKKLIFCNINSELFKTNKNDFNSISSVTKTLVNEQASLVFISSESKHETLKWQKILNLEAPFIVENGSAIYIPKDYDNLILSSYPPLDGWHCVVLGKPHDFISAYLSTIKEKYNIQISPSSKAYEFSEIFSMDDPNLWPILSEEASLFGLTIKEKDRFFYALGKGASEDSALQILTALYRRSDYETKSIFLKNSKNLFLDLCSHLESKA